MSPWEFAIGQIVGYKPFGPKWRGRVTAIEREGKYHYAVIPVVDGNGIAIVYEQPPKKVQPIIGDFENYFLIEGGPQLSDPWIASQLDHEDRPPDKK